MSRPGVRAERRLFGWPGNSTRKRLSAAVVASSLVTPLVLLAVSTCGLATPTPAGRASEVRALTGARTRVVWIQGDGTDPFASGDRLVLMGLDTDDPRGERIIVGERRNYRKPLLTPSGDRVIFSTRSSPDADPAVMIVNWDGSGSRRLAPGFALTVWQDPADRRDWVYVGLDGARDDFRTVRRFRIDDPASGELVWNKTVVSADSFQVSADGRSAGGLFPWPEAGIVQLPNRSWRKLGEGCWTALSDVGTPLFWYFDGSHRNLSMVDVGSDTRWTVSINSAPGFGTAETYHPRWSNHPRFLAVTGPYNQGGQNQVRSGGAQAEVWLGRFSDDFTRVEQWARVTHNGGGDAYPDVWIDSGRSEYPVRARGPLGPAAKGLRSPEGAGIVPGAPVERLVVSARLVTAGPIPSPRSIAPYRHALVANLYEVVTVTGGSYREPRVLVAQWAIRDGRVLANARRTPGTIYRLVLEPYDAHPELEGERLVLGDGLPGLRLLYEVGSR